MKKVSVIIPVYNGEKHIERCIYSIINQTYKNLEIICLNDGSKDNTLKILKSITDDRLVIINKKNTGVSDTRNKGIKVSTGDYITFCDADDYFEENYVEKMVKTIKIQQVDAVRCNYKLVDVNNVTTNTENLKDIANNKFAYQDIKLKIIPKLLDGSLPCFTCLLLIKSDVAKKIKFPKEIHVMEDTIFYLNLFLSIKNVYILDEKLYSVVVNNESVTNSSSNLQTKIINVLNAYKYLIKILKEYNILNNNQELLSNNAINIISDFLVRYYNIDNKKTLSFIKELQSNENLKTLLENINIEKLNIQRKLIIKNLKNNNIRMLKFWFIIRKLIAKIRRTK